MIKIFVLILSVVAVLSSCRNDNVEEMHPAKGCDTTKTISFTADIQPILNTSCGTNNGLCHIDNQVGSGIGLSNYNDVSVAVSDSLIIPDITHDPSLPYYRYMPSGGQKLDDCTINTIIAWINRGAPNN